MAWLTDIVGRVRSNSFRVFQLIQKSPISLNKVNIKNWKKKTFSNTYQISLPIMKFQPIRNVKSAKVE